MRLSRRLLHAFQTSALACVLALDAGAQTADADALARGAYQERAGDCVSCHTAQGGQPFVGGLRMDTPFGNLLRPNITPAAATDIGHWSADEFHRALHQGVNQRGQDMFPVMPFDFYTRVTRQDSDASYACLRSVAPVKNAVVVNHLRFPFTHRWAMAVWREPCFSAGSFEPDPGKSTAWNRGAYLVEGLDHCSACHSPRNALGGIEMDKAYTGATIDGWFALNLRSELHKGLGQWSAEQTANDLKIDTVAGKTTVLGPMAEVVKNGAVLAGDPTEILKEVLYGVPAQGKYVPMPGFASQLSDQQVADLTHYLRGSWGNAAAANSTAAMSARVRAAGSC